jgi:hypothetical protein
MYKGSSGSTSGRRAGIASATVTSDALFRTTPHRAALIVMSDQHHPASEVRIPERRAGDQQVSAKVVHMPIIAR